MSKHRSPDKGLRQPMARVSSLRHRRNSRTTNTGGLERLDTQERSTALIGQSLEIGSAVVSDSERRGDVDSFDEPNLGGITSVGAAVAAAVTEMVLGVGQDFDGTRLAGQAPDAALCHQGVDHASNERRGLDPKGDPTFTDRWRNAVRGYLGSEEFDKLCLSMRQRAGHDRDSS